MIRGLGIDLVAVRRVREALERHGDRFFERVCTPAELAYCRDFRDPGERLAGRWAAKEAVLKALGTGLAREALMTEVEVLNGPAGAPILTLHGGALAAAQALGATAWHLSLTHADGMAAAVAVLEG